jgi:hypothetical protein
MKAIRYDDYSAMQSAGKKHTYIPVTGLAMMDVRFDHLIGRKINLHPPCNQKTEADLSLAENKIAFFKAGRKENLSFVGFENVTVKLSPIDLKFDALTAWKIR